MTMTNDLKTQLEQAAKRISESGVIAIVLPDMPSIEIVGSCAALTSGLRAIGKTVSVFAPPALASTALVPWGAVTGADEPLREFIISFDLARSPIKELKYERSENRLNIILSPTGSRLKREDVEFRYGGLRYDLVIAIGVSGIEDAGASIRSVPELLYEKPILNLDTNPANACFGELNLVPDDSKPDQRLTMPELTHSILTALNVPADDPERSNALFAALAASTNEFRPGRTSAKAFLLAGELLSRGADPKLMRQTLILGRTLAEDQLMARAMARSRFQKELNILWSLLTPEDFAKTDTSPLDALQVLEKIMDTLPYSGRYALLFQDPADNAVRCLLAWRNGEDDKLKQFFAAAPGAKAYTTESHFPSFSAAEEHIAGLLQKADEVE